MKVYENLLERKTSLAVVGLGYVGMPIAVAFAKKVKVIGFDLNQEKINKYLQGIDPTHEVGDEEIRNTTVQFTSDTKKLKEASFFLVAVPTPINIDKTPDLTPIESVSRTIGANLKPGSIVVYESTVYPGVTEDICIPILEEASGLKCGVDFKVGYSPERINPGDKIHTLESIIKIVSGIDEETLDEIGRVYELVVNAGVHKAKSIKVAEAAKVVENSQRDINVAFMNELAVVFDRMNISTSEVVEAMNTKWNALKFYPGLVGGHCIGVDPYYFIYEAEKLGYHSQIILSGRKINDGMGAFVGDAIIKELVKSGKVVKDAKVAILGMTFKENCPDTRNSKVIDIVERLKEYEINPILVDPYAENNEFKREYGLSLTSENELNDIDCIVFAVAHDEYKNFSLKKVKKLLNHSGSNVLVDIKSLFNKNEVEDEGIVYWSL